MTKQHQDILTARLEDAYWHGCSHISWNELYHWYDVQKIAAGTWRDLNTRWDDLTEGESGNLMKIESGRGGIYIYGDKEATKVSPDGNGN